MRPPQDALDRLDESIKKLKTAYEKYFAGIERVAPTRDREEVKKMLRRLIGRKINNTAWRFRLQSLQATLVTHESYWDRVTRQIEEGTYHRDRFRLHHKQTTAPPPETSGAPEGTQEPPSETLGANPAAPELPARPATQELPPRPEALAMQPQQPSAGPRAALSRLHSDYNEARRKAGERDISIEALGKTVSKQTALLKEKYGCRRVEFKVAVKNGKPVLKAIPR